MEELTMLVRLAGGEQEAVTRLRAAGFRGVKDLARADIDELSRESGLTLAASRRLVRAALESSEPLPERKLRAPRSGLEVVSPSATSGEERHPHGIAGGPESPAPTADPKAATGQGVSKQESSALTGEAPREEHDRHSFWRFG